MKKTFTLLCLAALLAGSRLHAQPTAQPSTLNSQPASTNRILELDGTNGFLELPSGAFNDLEEVTIEGWVKSHLLGA